jgi:hypothetical protein
MKTLLILSALLLTTAADARDWCYKDHWSGCCIIPDIPCGPFTPHNMLPLPPYGNWKKWHGHFINREPSAIEPDPPLGLYIMKRKQEYEREHPNGESWETRQPLYRKELYQDRPKDPTPYARGRFGPIDPVYLPYPVLGTKMKCWDRYLELRLPIEEYQKFMKICLYPHTLEDCSNYKGNIDPCVGYVEEPTMKDAPSWLVK